VISWRSTTRSDGIDSARTPVGLSTTRWPVTVRLALSTRSATATATTESTGKSGPTSAFISPAESGSISTTRSDHGAGQMSLTARTDASSSRARRSTICSLRGWLSTMPCRVVVTWHGPKSHGPRHVRRPRPFSAVSERRYQPPPAVSCRAKR
jgi:hypothetical protein